MGRKGVEMKKRERVVYTEKYDSRFPGTSLPEFAVWLNSKIAEIPAEYLPEATIEFDVDTHYEDSNPTIEISYMRPETTQEANDREYESRQRKLQELYRAQGRVTMLMREVGDGEIQGG